EGQPVLERAGFQLAREGEGKRGLAGTHRSCDLRVAGKARAEARRKARRAARVPPRGEGGAKGQTRGKARPRWQEVGAQTSHGGSGLFDGEGGVSESRNARKFAHRRKLPA